MLLAHAVTLAEARSYLAALADQALTFDASVEYERVLLQLDFLHGDFIPGISRVPAIASTPPRHRVRRDRGTRRARDRPALSRVAARHAGGGVGEGLARCTARTAAHLRDAMGVLLREHRIQQRLGGKGTHTMPKQRTAAERARTSAGRSAAIPQRVLPGAPSRPRCQPTPRPWRQHGPQPRTSRGSARSHLTRSAGGVERRPGALRQLTTEQQFATVEAWRLAARAAVLGEHDFPGGVRYSALPTSSA